jgi:hypothetical protein
MMPYLIKSIVIVQTIRLKFLNSFFFISMDQIKIIIIISFHISECLIVCYEPKLQVFKKLFCRCLNDALPTL